MPKKQNKPKADERKVCPFIKIKDQPMYCIGSICMAFRYVVDDKGKIQDAICTRLIRGD